MNDDPLDTSIIRIPSKHRDPMPSWSKVIGSKLSNKSIADIYARCRMNLVNNTVLSESANLMDFGMLYVHTSDELRSIFVPINRIKRPIDGSYSLLPDHFISGDIADRVSGTKAKKQYNFKVEFETSRDKVVDTYFGLQNGPMSQPHVDSTPFGTNRTNGTTSSDDSIPVGTKSSNHATLILPTDLPVLPTDLLGDQDPNPSLSDSSKKSNSLNDTN